MAPMTRSRASVEHTPTPMMADYYAIRASGGLLITEGVAPAASGAGYARIPGIWNEEQTEAWKPITQAVHDRGGRVAIQLMHTGRVGHSENLPEDAAVLAPSSTRNPGEMHTDAKGAQPYPQALEMSPAQVREALESYVSAARNSMTAGFDLIELHGANGYLIDQFLSPTTNQRNDHWGGEFENRARFALEVARRTAAEIGSEKVGIRLSPLGVFNGIEPWQGLEEDFIWLAGQLGNLNLAYLHIVDHSAMGAPPVSAELKQKMRTAFDGPLILSGGYNAAQAEADLKADKGELIAFGRPYIANPDLVERIAQGADLTLPDMETFYTPGEKGYLDYPTL
jgi:N-ethylmaleimide reductase